MKTRSYLLKIILPMLFLCVALLGVSYSGWVNSNKIVAYVSSAVMDYNFEYTWNKVMLVHKDGTTETINANISVKDGKILDIELMDGGILLGLTCEQDILRIQYTLEGGNHTTNNIAMKPMDQYLGNYGINLDPGSVECDYMGTKLPAESFLNLLPSNLGTYRVYHRYDGTNGTIDFIPIQLPVITPTTLKKENMPIKLEGEESEDAALVLRGKYSFAIPLNFDQHNTK